MDRDELLALDKEALVELIVRLYERVTDKGVTVLVDRKASLFLIGTVMDYETKAMSAGFTFTNPNEKGRCGCGESFHV